MRATTEREIAITRVFDAPRQLVFQAWTNPLHLVQWWGPNGFSAGDCQIDLRVGGQFCLILSAPDGSRYPCEGTFREVQEPERLVFAGHADERHPCGAGIPPHSIVTVTFEEQDGKTTLTLHTLLPSPAAKAATTAAGFNPGWQDSLERLAAALGA